jgi:hypothetical protein
MMRGPSNEKAPALQAGASIREHGHDRFPHNSLAGLRAQFLIAAHHVRPELATMIAAAAFGGGHG